MAKKPVGVESLPEGTVTKPVPGTNGKYIAANDGFIYCFSDARVNRKRPRPFRVTVMIGSKGYPFICMIADGKKSSRPVHNLVCTAFHGPKPSIVHLVRHLNGEKRDNHPSNLAWGTPSENEADKKRHGTAAIGSRQGSAKLTDEAVRIIRASIPFGLWDTENAAKVFGISRSRIRAIANGRGWNHLDDIST